MKEKVISMNMIEKIQVQFKKKICEDDFPEKGMKAWLTDIEWIEKCGCYKLFFDFKDFEDRNDAYFKEVYYENLNTKDLPKKKFYTAKEAGYYNSKYSVYFSPAIDNTRNDELFEQKIIDYLRVTG